MGSVELRIAQAKAPKAIVVSSHPHQDVSVPRGVSCPKPLDAIRDELTALEPVCWVSGKATRRAVKAIDTVDQRSVAGRICLDHQVANVECDLIRDPPDRSGFGFRGSRVGSAGAGEGRTVGGRHAGPESRLAIEVQPDGDERNRRGVARGTQRRSALRPFEAARDARESG